MNLAPIFRANHHEKYIGLFSARLDFSSKHAPLVAAEVSQYCLPGFVQEYGGVLRNPSGWGFRIRSRSVISATM